jgi:hypothetical protein
LAVPCFNLHIAGKKLFVTQTDEACFRFKCRKIIRLLEEQSQRHSHFGPKFPQTYNADTLHTQAHYNADTLHTQTHYKHTYTYNRAKGKAKV